MNPLDKMQHAIDRIAEYDDGLPLVPGKARQQRDHERQAWMNEAKNWADIILAQQASVHSAGETALDRLLRAVRTWDAEMPTWDPEKLIVAENAREVHRALEAYDRAGATCACGLNVAPGLSLPYTAKDGSVHGLDVCHDADEAKRLREKFSPSDVALTDSNDHGDEKKPSSVEEVGASPIGAGGSPERAGVGPSAGPHGSSNLPTDRLAPGKTTDASSDPQYVDPKYWTEGEGRRAWDRLKARVATLEDRLWLYEQTVTNVMSELGGLGTTAIDTGLVDVVAEASERGIGVMDVMKERVSDDEPGTVHGQVTRSTDPCRGRIATWCDVHHAFWPSDVDACEKFGAVHESGEDVHIDNSQTEANRINRDAPNAGGTAIPVPSAESSSEVPDNPAGEPAARHKGPQGSVERGGGVTRDSEGDRLSPASVDAAADTFHTPDTFYDVLEQLMRDAMQDYGANATQMVAAIRPRIVQELHATYRAAINSPVASASATDLDDVRSTYFKSGWDSAVRDVCERLLHPVYEAGACACDFLGSRKAES